MGPFYKVSYQFTPIVCYLKWPSTVIFIDDIYRYGNEKDGGSSGRGFRATVIFG